jgi:hypothetical protein
MTLKNAVTKGVKAWRDRRVGYWLCIDPKTGEYYLLTSANYSYSELSEEAKATAYKAWKPDYAFEADNHRTLEAFCTAFGVEVTEYVYEAYYHSFRWRVKNEGDEEITDNEYIRHCLSLFEPTGFYLDDVILGPAKQPTEGKVFGNVIEECLEAFFSACCEDVKYAESQEYFADFADNNELEFYENGICIRHR